jgi:hypothetical protein
VSGPGLILPKVSSISISATGVDRDIDAHL